MSRRLSSACAPIAAWWSLRPGLDVIARLRQLGDERAHVLGLGGPQRRDVGLARGGVERDARQAERALQRADRRVDVLDAADRDDRAPHRPQAALQVDLVVADLVAPS